MRGTQIKNLPLPTAISRRHECRIRCLPGPGSVLPRRAGVCRAAGPAESREDTPNLSSPGFDQRVNEPLEFTRVDSTPTVSRFSWTT